MSLSEEYLDEDLQDSEEVILVIRVDKNISRKHDYATVVEGVRKIRLSVRLISSGITCCPNESRCPVDASGEEGPRFAYSLKYTITYDDDLTNKIPIQMLVFDVTTPGGNGQECTVEYQVC